ncbi:MAG: type IV secretory system conjugative DNA transfer family protein [Bacteroidota bacterium]
MAKRAASDPAPLQKNESGLYSFHEILGRGWTLWDDPIEIEPPFNYANKGRSVERTVVDDGKKDWLPVRIGRRLVQPLLRAKANSSNQVLPPQYVKPRRYSPQKAPIELKCVIPTDCRIKKEVALEFLLAIPSTAGATSFEIIATAESIEVQFATREDAGLLTQHIKGYFPRVIVFQNQNHLVDVWQGSNSDNQVIFEIGLSEAYAKPIRVPATFEVDPLIPFLNALENLEAGEVAIVQVLFQPARHPWKRHAARLIHINTQSSRQLEISEVAKSIQKKMRQPFFSSVIRIASRARTEAGLWHIAGSLTDSFRQFGAPTGNSFIPLENTGYTTTKQEKDLFNRTSHRSGMLLGANELVNLVHLPSISVKSSKLVRQTKKTKAVPRIAVGNDLILGDNYHDGRTVKASLNGEQRTKHTHIIGASGTGKSHLLLSLLIQDLKTSNGFAVLDPHGDLIDRLLPYVPESRLDDVILFDPADEQFPIGFNILQAHSTLEKQLLSSDLVAVFKRLSTSWGDQMTSVLGNSILAFLESEKGGTLADMRRFLVEKEFRKEFLKTVTDHEVLYYWQKEYPLLSGRPQAPLLTRLDTFLRPKLIRHIVAQKENKLDFGHIMNSGKILLAKLAQGAIGEENSYLLGSLLVSKFYQLALSRQELQEASRKPFYLYIDEFHHFITPTLSTILSGARKYRLGLTLAHQDMRQLQSRDTELQSAVLTNPYTRICFRVGDMDARSLETGFAFFEGKDLQNLGRGEAVIRVERTDYDFNLETYPLPEIVEDSENHIQSVIERSRQNYGTPLEEVEELLQQARAPIEENEPATPQPNKRTVRETEPPESVEPVNIVEDDPKRPIITPPPKPKAAPPPAPKKTPKQKAQLGKGGQQHRYLQELIKRWGEHNGFRATIEKPIPDSRESIDVALETDETTIACEISVTSTPDYELGNVQKCLNAGYDTVALVSADDKTLRKAEKHIKAKLDKKKLPKVKFLSPEDLFAFLGEIPNSRTEEVVGGYTVKVRVKPGSKEDAATRKKAISDVILSAMRRMKDT